MSKTLYACGVDWQHEIGKVPLYYSVEELKAKRTCWKECGIIEIHLTAGKWVEPQNLT